MTITEPSACQHCGITRREHMQRWTTSAGWHQWTPPTTQQIKARMRARSARG
ncbi:hypothetical protein [Streptomyces sp. NBC_00239]|uniref:hypothetical protein n=1 Tax=Streptomyces sp. NBC_00239 TaxID=2903640 RepID=UPI002E29C80F|nr:hypothetical protein [Streptomyces sp. NBC_00239]